jgi:hypothetical protein
MLDPVSERIERLILARGERGIERVRAALVAGYCARAAALLETHRARVAIATGFPVAATFETDGPLGAVAVYEALERLGGTPSFVCAPPISRALATRFRTHEVPILDATGSIPAMDAALDALRPTLIVSIERPGVAADGRYYNMAGADITDGVGKLDVLIERAGCPVIAVGDGGNEVGMGNVRDALAGLPIVPATTRCDELVIASVSNWGAYAMVAELGRRCGLDLLHGFDSFAVGRWLLDHGAVDGRTAAATLSEDGFPLEVGRALLEELRRLSAVDGSAA